MIKKINYIYLNNLIEQFKSSTGIRKIDVNSKEFIKDFSNFLNLNKSIGDEYRKFARELGLISFTSAIEVGKGCLDTITTSDILMITPYEEGLKNEKLINGDFKVIESMPIVTKDDESFIVNTRIIDRFITQNPYSKTSIKNWESLHNVGANITIGVYGSLSHKDKDKKILELKEFKRKLLTDDYEEEYETFDNMYFYAIASSRNKKLLRKINR